MKIDTDSILYQGNYAVDFPIGTGVAKDTRYFPIQKAEIKISDKRDRVHVI